MRKLAIALAALTFLAACTAHAPHRLDKEGQALEVRLSPGELATPEGRKKASTSALETHDDFQLHFLESDDQGHLFSRAPLELLIQTPSQGSRESGSAENHDRPLRPRLAERRAALQRKRVLFPDLLVADRGGREDDDGTLGRRHPPREGHRDLHGVAGLVRDPSSFSRPFVLLAQERRAHHRKRRARRAVDLSRRIPETRQRERPAPLPPGDHGSQFWRGDGLLGGGERSEEPHRRRSRQRRPDGLRRAHPRVRRPRRPREPGVRGVALPAAYTS